MGYKAVSPYNEQPEQDPLCLVISLNLLGDRGFPQTG